MQGNGSNLVVENSTTKMDKGTLRKMLREATAEYKEAKVHFMKKRRKVKTLRRALKKEK